MNYQKGIGLIEILASMLILAIAVLGFIALQYRSLDIAAEALKRVEAINLARNLAERIYVNKTAYSDYKSIATSIGTATSCLNTSGCNATAFAAKDLADIKAQATARGMSIGVDTCPNTTNGRQCIFVAWDATKAEKGSCTETDSFVYKADAKCVVVEAF